MRERYLLMIPGPIQFNPEVLRAMSRTTCSYTSPEFIEIFGGVLENLRKVFFAPHGQPFVVAGSGTLAMDMAIANLVEPGDKVLVVSTGYFSDRFVTIAEHYGAKVTRVGAAIGDIPPLEEVDAAFEKDKYKLLTVAHSETSTGVAADIEAFARLASKYDALSIVDGVSAAAAMECRQEEWGIDVYLTASQKAIGVPPGLAILMASSRALETFKKRKMPVSGYYVDWGNWLPVMKAYEARQPSYFATPPVNMIYALKESLCQILDEGMEARFRRHRIISQAFKAAVSAMKLRQVPLKPGNAIHTLTAIYYPEGVNSSLLRLIKKNGVVVAGGIQPEIKDRYFRVGHMGTVTAGDILTTVGAIEKALTSAGCAVELGAGLAAAQKILGQL